MERKLDYHNSKKKVISSGRMHGKTEARIGRYLIDTILKHLDKETAFMMMYGGSPKTIMNRELDKLSKYDLIELLKHKIRQRQKKDLAKYNHYNEKPFNIQGTVTGRIKTSGPEIQEFPKPHTSPERSRAFSWTMKADTANHYAFKGHPDTTGCSKFKNRLDCRLFPDCMIQLKNAVSACRYIIPAMVMDKEKLDICDNCPHDKKCFYQKHGGPIEGFKCRAVNRYES